MCEIVGLFIRAQGTIRGMILDLVLAGRGDFCLLRRIMEQPPSVPQTPSPTPAKKGVPPIAWVGIGCGGFLILAIIVGSFIFSKVKGKFDEFAKNPEKAAAEMMVSRNPHLELVSQDAAQGEMTIRTKDGKEVTLSYKDISEGRITVEDADGNLTDIGSTDLSVVPAWVPRAPDLTDTVSMFHTESGSEITGLFSGRTPAKAGELKTFYEGAASSLGTSSSSNSSMTANGTSVITLDYSGGGKSLKIIITEKPGSATLVNTNYSEDK